MARDKKMVSIKLDVIDENPDAKRLYEKIGFKPIKKIVQKAISIILITNYQHGKFAGSKINTPQCI